MVEPAITAKITDEELLRMTADVVAAYVSNNPTPISELPGMIRSIHATLGGLSGGGIAEIEARWTDRALVRFSRIRSRTIPLCQVESVRQAPSKTTLVSPNPGKARVAT